MSSSTGPPSRTIRCGEEEVGPVAQQAVERGAAAAVAFAMVQAVRRQQQACPHAMASGQQAWPSARVHAC